jgi:hypothetical protein
LELDAFLIFCNIVLYIIDINEMNVIQGVMHQIKKLCEPEALDLSAKKASVEATPSSSTMVPALASDLSGGPPQPGSSLSASLLDSPGLAMAPVGYELSPQTLPVPDASKQGTNGSSGSPRL